MKHNDLEAALREVEAVVQRLDTLRLEAEGALRDLRRNVEQQAMDAVANAVAPDKQAEAKAMAVRVVRIVDEVGAWAVARSPIGLVQRLLPEVREGMRELQALVADKTPEAQVTVTRSRTTGSGATPAWHAP